MPGIISIEDFVRETREDFNSPTTSTFVSMLPQFRNSVSSLEEMLDRDREGLSKMRKAVKAISNSGNVNCDNQLFFSKQLKELSEKRDYHGDISDAYGKFSSVTKELCSLTRALTQNLSNTVLFPVENLLKGDLKGAKGDLKRPVDRAWKDYETKFIKIEKEKQRQAREAGLIRSEISAAELADVMDHERKLFQLHMCEYLIKTNEICTKKEVDLLQHLIDYHHAQNSYFRSGLRTLDQFGTYIQDLAERIQAVRAEQEDDRRRLVELRSLLQQSQNSDVKEPASSPGYSLHRPVGDKSHGYTRRGFLLKKSEGKVRKVWQKRRSEVRDGYLYIWHSDETKPPTTFNLLTCHVRPVSDDRRSFDLISFNRTYHLQAEDEFDRAAWVAVLVNCKEGALQKVFDDSGKSSDETSQGLRELQQSIIDAVQRIPGNDKCADCSSENDVTWLSTNFGVVVCIECSGIHRELGVHISRIQSLTLDHVGTSQLLLARVLGNIGFNEIMEATLPPAKRLKSNSSMEERCAFIRGKYVERRHVLRSSSDQHELMQDVELAVSTRHVKQLLQAHAEGVNLSAPLTGSQLRENPLHLAVRQEVDGSSLHIVDFLVQNSSGLDSVTAEGNSPLHYCAIYNRPECMKLLLRSGADHSPANGNGKTPLDIATERGYSLCRELIEHAIAGKKSAFDNVHVDTQSWAPFGYDDGSTDFSDDDMPMHDERYLNVRSSSDSLRTSPCAYRRSDVTRRGQTKRPRPVSMAAGRPSAAAAQHSLSAGSLQRPLQHTVSAAPAAAPAGGGGTRLANGRSTESLPVAGDPTAVAEQMARVLRQRADSCGRGARRCRAMYDCQADNDDELTFTEGEILVILAESTEDEDWMEGYVDGQPHRRGMFPMSFVYMLND